MRKLRRPLINLRNAPVYADRIRAQWPEYDQNLSLLPGVLCENCRIQSTVSKFLCAKLDQARMWMRSTELDNRLTRNCKCTICTIATRKGPMNLHRHAATSPRAKATKILASPSPPSTASPTVSRRNKTRMVTRSAAPPTVSLRNKKRVVTRDVDPDWVPSPKRRYTKRKGDTTAGVIGRPKITRTPQPPPVMTHDAMNAMRLDAGLTQRQLYNVSKHMRRSLRQRGVVEPGLRNNMVQRNRTLDDIFAVCTSYDLPAVICTDVRTLIARTCAHRGLDADNISLLKIGIDVGRGSLKFSMSIVSGKTPPRQKKRVTYNTKLSDIPMFRETGVKKLLLLALVPGATEKYVTVADILQRLVHDYPAVLCSDLKVVNLVLGLQPHSSKHPCPFCLWMKGDRNQVAPPRTFEHIREWNGKWVDAGGIRSNLMDFFNCEFVPMAIFPRSGRIMDYVPIPELHILMGIVNKLYKEMSRIYENVAKWPAQLYLVADKPRNKFNGNACRKLLKNILLLRALIDHDFPPIRISRRNAAGQNARLREFALTLGALDTLVHKTFGMVLRNGWASAHAEFTAAYLKLGISITSKVHIIMAHLPQFIRLQGSSLGKFSEQAFESVHFDFDNKWLTTHCVVDPKNPKYSSALRQTILEYNAAHL